MEGFANKIKKAIDNLTINDVSKLKSSRYTKNIKVVGKGCIRCFSVTAPKNLYSGNLILIIDEEKTFTFPVDINNGSLFFFETLSYLVLNEKIPFNRSFEFKIDIDAVVGGTVFYTLE